MTGVIHKIQLLFVSIIVLSATSSHAFFKKDENYGFISATGFFVSNYHIVTNSHVLGRCVDIVVKGSIPTSKAKIVAIDEENDLALLRVASSPKNIAMLRDKSDLEIGEDVTVIGYPLEKGITGEYSIRKSKITSLHDPIKASDRFHFVDSVEKGNSGGPLLDKFGSVIGVVVGKMGFFVSTYSKEEKKYIPQTKPYKQDSVAISLNVLKDFLNKNKVYYQTAKYKTNYNDNIIENIGNDYIVNIHCVIESK